MTHKSPEIDQLLEELGNTATTIPYYAIYPSNGGEPTTFGGLITPWQILRALHKAGPSNTVDASATVSEASHSMR